MNKEESPLYNEKPDFYYTGANPHLLKHIKKRMERSIRYRMF